MPNQTTESSSTDNKKRGGDFRYATAESKVPWHAVGEVFGEEDALEIVKFLLPDSENNPEYHAALREAQSSLERLARVSGRATKLTLGTKVAEAEECLKKFCGSKHALLTTNWTAGMEIAYKLSGLNPGDEIIMPAITFIATMAYPLSIGAKVVFADIDPETANIDPADVARKITPRTKVIAPVHLGGCPAEMDPIMALAEKHGIYVMEDAAHGLGGAYKGRQLGSIGHFGGFSFHEVKNINSLGEGGITLTNIDSAGEQFARSRFLGLDFSRRIKDWLYDISPLVDRFGGFQVAGNHSAMEIQAIGLLQQMKRLPAILEQRREAAAYMHSILSQEEGILPEKQDTADTYGTHHLFMLRIDPEKTGGDIQNLSARLKAKGLTNITHFGPMYRFRIMSELGYKADEIAETCPNTEKSFYRGYTHLPLYPLTREQLEYQAAAVVEAVQEMKREA